MIGFGLCRCQTIGGTLSPPRHDADAACPAPAAASPWAAFARRYVERRNSRPQALECEAPESVRTGREKDDKISGA